jgi:O-antigen/teichoic acid export membrane protein
MSLRANIFANYAGVVIATILTFLVTPIYLRWLGAEAYGLVGIASMIQGWIMLLNAGLAPVAGRTAAEASAGKVDWLVAGRFFRTIDWLLAALSFPILCMLIFSSHWLATHWLKKGNLDTATIALSLILLVVMTLIRLSAGVSRGIIANMEAQVWLNTNLVIFSLLRFAVSLPLVYLWPNVITLFSWWLIVSAAEYFSIQYKISTLIPTKIPLFVFDIDSLKKSGKMAATLAFTSTVWVLITQLDKLVLSKILPLANYGYYSIATLLAGGVLILGQPIGQAFQPRLTRAFSEGGINATCKELQRCTQLTVLMTFPIGAVLFAFPEAVLYVWTGNHEIANHGANVLRGYVVGNTLIAAGGLLYFLQVAIGNVRWHFRGNILLAAILVPMIPWLASRYGADGAAWLWASTNFFLFLVWNSVLLKKVAKPLFPHWLLRDTLRPFIFTFSLATIFSSALSGLQQGRLGLFLICLSVGIITFITTALSMQNIRHWLIRKTSEIFKIT